MLSLAPSPRALAALGPNPSWLRAPPPLYQAIACLRRAVASDAHNLEALLSLGVSYTNELDQTRALEHLQVGDVGGRRVGAPANVPPARVAASSLT